MIIRKITSPNGFLYFPSSDTYVTIQKESISNKIVQNDGKVKYFGSRMGIPYFPTSVTKRIRVCKGIALRNMNKSLFIEKHLNEKSLPINDTDRDSWYEIIIEKSEFDYESDYENISCSLQYASLSHHGFPLPKVDLI